MDRTGLITINVTRLISMVFYTKITFDIELAIEFNCLKEPRSKRILLWAARRACGVSLLTVQMSFQEHGENFNFI